MCVTNCLSEIAGHKKARRRGAGNPWQNFELYLCYNCKLQGASHEFLFIYHPVALTIGTGQQRQKRWDGLGTYLLRC